MRSFELWPMCGQQDDRGDVEFPDGLCMAISGRLVAMSGLTMTEPTAGCAKVATDLRASRFNGLGALSVSLAEFFDKVGCDDFFLSRPWFENFDRTIVRKDESVVLYGVEPSDGTADAFALLPLWQMRPRSWLAPTLWQSLTNYYTPHFGPLFRGICQEQSIRALAQALWADRRHFAAVDLRCLDQAGFAYSALVESLKDCGFLVQTYFQFGNWYLDVAGRSYAEYFTSLSSVLKKNIPYQTRRFERTHRVEWKLVTSRDGFEAALADYEQVYHTSWRDKEAYPDFIRGLAEAALSQGALRLGLLYADGMPVAAQFWIVYGGTASIYKIAYIEPFAKFSVGTVLTAHMMRHAIDVDKVSIVDYLSGDDSYKKDWMSHRRERWGLMAFNPHSVGGLLLAARHVGGRRLKELWQRGR